MKQIESRITLSAVIFYAIFILMLVVGFYYLFDGLQALLEEQVESAIYYFIMGGIGVGVSIYLATMLRRRSLSKKPKSKVVTTIECKACSLKSLRGFIKGDYVLQSVEPCSKCKEPMLITAIYAEKLDKK